MRPALLLSLTTLALVACSPAPEPAAGNAPAPPPAPAAETPMTEAAMTPEAAPKSTTGPIDPSVDSLFVAIAKLGATREGVLRRHKTTWTGRVRDTVMFSITEDSCGAHDVLMGGSTASSNANGMAP